MLLATASGFTIKEINSICLKRKGSLLGLWLKKFSTTAQKRNPVLFYKLFYYFLKTRAKLKVRDYLKKIVEIHTKIYRNTPFLTFF